MNFKRWFWGLFAVLGALWLLGHAWAGAALLVLTFSPLAIAVLLLVFGS